MALRVEAESEGGRVAHGWLTPLRETAPNAQDLECGAGRVRDKGPRGGTMGPFSLRSSKRG